MAETDTTLKPSEIIPISLPNHPGFKNIIGQKFERLAVIAYVGSIRGKTRWLCICDCGTQKTIPKSDLVTGHAKSCGCLRIEMCRSRAIPPELRSQRDKEPEYTSWAQMKNRCKYPSHQSYIRYGGRGIKVCVGFNDSYEYFVKIVGRKANRRLHIDRKNNDGNYSCGQCGECVENNWPLNVRWVTAKENSLNTSANHILTHRGVSKTLTEWAEEKGMSPVTLASRINALGWSAERAIDEPVGFAQKR